MTHHGNTEDLNSRLQSHLRHAYENVPFYRKLYDAAGVRMEDVKAVDDLHLLPMIEKDQMIRDQKENPPFGSFTMTAADLNRVNLIASSYYMCLTHEDQLGITRLYRESYEVMGVRDTDLVDISGTYHWVAGGLLRDEAMRSLGAAVIPSGPGQSEQRLRVLKDTRATVLQAFTPYAEELTRQFEANGIDPRRDLNIRLVIISGELRDSKAKHRLEEAWGGAAVRECYGVSEAGLVAAECFEVGDGMHLSPHCIIEVIDPETGRTVAPGQPGEIVTTELMRKGQPFIRFRTGDITEGIRYEPCACGRSSPRMGRILGRRSQIPRVRGLFVPPALIERAVREYPQAGAWKLIISRPGTMDAVNLQVELPAQSDISDKLTRTLKAAVGITIQIEPVPPASIDASTPQIVDQRVFL